MTMKLNKPELEFPEFIGQPTVTDNGFGYFRIEDPAIEKTVKPLSMDVRCRIGITMKVNKTKRNYSYLNAIKKLNFYDIHGQRLFKNRHYLTFVKG